MKHISKEFKDWLGSTTELHYSLGTQFTELPRWIHTAHKQFVSETGLEARVSHGKYLYRALSVGQGYIEPWQYMEDGGRKDNDNIRETAHEWASNTLNGQIILDTGYRRFKYGFRRVNKLPADVRDEKIKQYLTGWSWQLPEARCSV